MAKETYRYDAAGRRVTADSPTLGKNRSFYNRDGSLAFRHDGRRQMSFAYVYLAGSLVATREQSTATTVAAMKYHHTDALGTPVATTDASRNVVERSEYEPYGKLLNRPANDGPGFTGHVEDAQTGLVYMQQRYYDPLCGCFLSLDPVTPYWRPGLNFNRYWYANNNPYTFSDPDGRYAHILIGGGVGAAFGGGLEIYRQLRADGKVSSWKNVGIETAKGGLVGGLTAAVPGSTTLTFGGSTAKGVVSLGNALAVGAGGEVAAQFAKGEDIDTDRSLDAGIANGAGLLLGAAAAPLAKALSSTTIPANPGVQVTSLRGRNFIVGATPASTTTSEGMKQTIQGVSGATGSSLVEGQK